MAGSRPSLEQAVINNVKMARTLITLRHRIEADDELNRVIPEIRSRLESQAASGMVIGLDYQTLRSLIYGEDA